MRFRVIIDRDDTRPCLPANTRWDNFKLWAVQLHEDGCLWRFAVVVLVMILLLVVFFLPLALHSLA